MGGAITLLLSHKRLNEPENAWISRCLSFLHLYISSPAILYFTDRFRICFRPAFLIPFFPASRSRSSGIYIYIHTPQKREEKTQPVGKMIMLRRFELLALLMFLFVAIFQYPIATEARPVSFRSKPFSSP